MRFRDAPHLDLGSFRSRLPDLGLVYRIGGIAACVGALWWAGDPRRIAILLVLLLIAWLMAWRRAVGSLYRGPLVAAIAMCAVILTMDRIGQPLHRADPGRPVIFRFDGPPPADAPRSLP